jgi:hypothetical protein
MDYIACWKIKKILSILTIFDFPVHYRKFKKPHQTWSHSKTFFVMKWNLKKVLYIFVNALYFSHQCSLFACSTFGHPSQWPMNELFERKHCRIDPSTFLEKWQIQNNTKLIKYNKKWRIFTHFMKSFLTFQFL